MKKVTGIGGIFFKCNDSEKLKEWYKTNLGFKTDDYGALFTWKDENGEKAVTQWSTFPATTDYFEPSKKEFMINYRVENLEMLLAEFQESGVTVLDKIEEFPYGKFVHILDPEGNKIELWEPKEFEL
ncbi:VOC family protein [bacterium]|nr:VOC family protein [bacterium]